MRNQELRREVHVYAKQTSASRPARQQGFLLRRLGILVAAIAASTAALGSAVADPIRPIALTGMDGAFGPQLGPGVEFADFMPDGNTKASPAINAHSDLVFVATLTGKGVTSDNDSGLWVYRGGQLSLVAREGDPAPGNAEGVVFARLGHSILSGEGNFDPDISDMGKVVFKAELRGPGVDNFHDGALFTEEDGSLHMVLRERVTEVPGHPGVFFGRAPNLGTPDGMWGTKPIYITRTGDVLTYLGITEIPGGELFSAFTTVKESNGVLETMVYFGDTLPGFPPATFVWQWPDPQISARGFMGDKRKNTHADIVDFQFAVWSDRSGTLDMLYPEGSEQMPVGCMFGCAKPVATTSVGLLVISSESGPNTWKIWSEAMYGIPLVIAQAGAAAPGTDAVFLHFDAFAVNDNGTFALKAKTNWQGQTNGTNDWGIWVNRVGTTLALELRKGDPVPGMPEFTIQELGYFSATQINDSGRLLVSGQASDNMPVLWFQDEFFEFQLLAKGLTEFDVHGDGSDVRLILDVFVETGEGSTADAYRNAINDNGAVTLRLQFIDGSEGVFTTACALGDNDCDGDVDLADHADFGACMTGPQNGPIGEGCATFDFDGDDDVDLGDVGVFQALFSE